MNTKQRIKAIGYLGMSLLSMSLVISGCGPTMTPTPTPAFSATLTPTPITKPTVTPTPAPEHLADANDLHVWIDDYVHAYGGKVAVNGLERDANQLLGAVKANPGSFIERKTIKGSETLFFVVNRVPLGIQTDGAWRSILARDIADAKDAQFAMPVLYYQIYNPNFVNAVKNANMVTMTYDLDNKIVFDKWTTEDWKTILRNWEAIKTQLDSGQIPNDMPYNWTQADQTINFSQDNHMGLRVGSLVWNGDVPELDIQRRIYESRAAEDTGIHDKCQGDEVQECHIRVECSGRIDNHRI